MRIITRNKDEGVNYEAAINKEFKRLGAFGGWTIENSVLYYRSAFANDIMFCKLGGIQQALIGAAYFRHGYDGFDGLSLSLDFRKTWQDVLDILTGIDRIELDD